MEFTIDRMSDVVALVIELAFILLVFRFMYRMKDSGAKVWQDMSEDLLILSVFLFLGQVFMFMSDGFSNNDHTLLLMLTGNLFWMASAYHGYSMVRKVTEAVGGMLA